jgi:hypothetical protein
LLTCGPETLKQFQAHFILSLQKNEHENNRFS